MQVLITVDTELSPRQHANGVAVKDNLQTAINGGAEGRFGIPHQLDELDRNGLKAVFFVEALCADVVGPEALAQIVRPIQAAGQDIQLHVHTEWLPHYPAETLNAIGVHEFHGNIGEYPLAQQAAIIRHGLKNLVAVGVPPPVAFRAGNFGADENTLEAVSSAGLTYDSSYSVSCSDGRGPCRVAPGNPLNDCRALRGAIEVPVTFFRDKVFGPRHLQLCSVSYTEMRHVLDKARDSERRTAVIVSHSFELLNRARERGHPMHVARFHELCRLLAQRRADMPTAGFGDLDAAKLTESKTQAIESSPFLTLHRMGLQIFGRLYG